MRSIERTGNAELRFRLHVQQSNRELLYFIDLVEPSYMNFISLEIRFCYKYYILYKSCVINQRDLHLCKRLVIS